MLTFFHPAVSALAFFQSTQLNLFERFLTQAVSGIDSTSITSGMQNVAYVVLLIGFLWQVYQSALHGGDVRGLGTNLIKYVVTAIVVMNYHVIFTTLNQGFVNAGNWINSASGTTNLLQNWGNDLKTQFNQVGFQKLWDLISAGVAGFLDAILIIVAYILYPVVIVIFGFFYILYGSILYIFGPIVIALMPLGATNRLAKSYVENVFIWNAWPVLYGGFGALLSAVQMGQIGQMLNQNDFLGGLGSVEGSLLIGLASIIYSLAIAVIPFIAKKIVSGEVGATAGALVGAAATALTAGIGVGEGVAAGISSSSASASSTAQGSTKGSATMSNGHSAGSGTNQPAAPQRTSSPTSAAETTLPANSPAEPAESGSASTTQGDMVADNIRGSLNNALNSRPESESHREQRAGQVDRANHDNATSLRGGAIDTASTSSSRGVSSSRRTTAAGRGPTPALMRPHGLATWGAYHTARLATHGAIGGARAAGRVAKGVAGNVANPIDTAGRLSFKAGEIVGNAMNVSGNVAEAAGKVAHAVTRPGESVGVGVQSATNAISGIAASTVSTIRQTTEAASTKFAESYADTRSGNSSKEETPE
jgi:hypothetical protein